MRASTANPRQTIAAALRAFLRQTHVRKVYFAHAGAAPPQLAYVTSFPRLSIVLAGKQTMEFAEHSGPARCTFARGSVIFVGPNCWNRPNWSTPAKVLTFLFGKKQIGISLVSHDGRNEEPTSALKTSLGPLEGLSQHLLSALAALAVRKQPSPLDRLITESLLHAAQQTLDTPIETAHRKAAHTHEALCLYVHEQFQNQITRESVAKNFGLTPNHVSRLFRREGNMRFGDYLTLVRIDRAKYMLKEYDSPLKEIAASCGYHDVAYFCRVFRRLTRTTPTDFRLKS